MINIESVTTFGRHYKKGQEVHLDEVFAYLQAGLIPDHCVKKFGRSGTVLFLRDVNFEVHIEIGEGKR